jgi:hypothetical protein
VEGGQVLLATTELEKIRKIDTAVRGLFERIPVMTEAQLIDTAVYAERLGRQAYIIRGACVSHLLESRQARLPGGRGKRDRARQGKCARMEDLAKRAGIHRRTLEIDARIYETLFANDENSQRGGARTAPLSRELYVIALSAPDPQAAIKEAVQHGDDHLYGRKQFRAYVRELKRAYQPQQSTDSSTDFVAVKVRLPPEIGHALSELETWTADSTDQVIAEALRRLHKSYRKRSIGTGRVLANTIAASSNAAPTQEQLLF